MKPQLSIIIPCYNCADTLTEALDSCYTQNLTDDDFEVILVDDGSIDSTRSVMEKLATEHHNIRLLFHDQNRGGGAARNTGIRSANGDIIYCLDSDNFFAPRSVTPMLRHLKETGAAGAAFFERRFFVGTNTRKYQSHFNKLGGESVQLFDIFNTSQTLLDNFFYTKDAYQKTTGYPEHHGFDTQCFEVRFLSAGNAVTIVPQSVFWHRQGAKEKSYFERVYEAGEYSLNLYYILEEILHLLTPVMREKILAYNVFNSSKMGSENIISMLSVSHQNNEDNFFIPDYKRYLQPHSQATYSTDYPADTLIRALYLYTQGTYTEASAEFLAYIEKHGGSTIMYFNCLRCAVGASGTGLEKIERVALGIAQSFTLKRHHMNLNPHFVTKIIRTLASYLR